MLRRTPWVLVLVALVGCAATHFENNPLPAGTTNEERRVIDQSDADRPLILVAVSGGGSRAAALGWAVLKELRNFTYTTNGQSHRLIDDIGVISSVSGGSVTAAYFALYGPDGLDQFEPKFLLPDNMRSLGISSANPISWIKLAITGSSRIDTVEALFDKELFDGKTFSALNQPGKPYLILNATDMAYGEVFAFTPQRFNDICADLDSEPISVGVAASSAVPIVLSPVALQNFSATNCRNTPAPTWINDELSGRYVPYINLDNFKRARYTNDLRHGQNSFRSMDYLYLLDGGLADNLAIHGLLDTISSPHATPLVNEGTSAGSRGSTILRAINDGRIKKVAVVVINARADPHNDIGQNSSRPGIVQMIGAVTSVPIDSTTASVDAQMELLLSQLNAAGAGGAGDPQFRGLHVYGIQIDFDQLRAGDPKQRELRDKAKAIPTLWTISKENLDVIEQVAHTLLYNHPCFQRLLLDENVKAEFIDPNFADMGCRQASD
jgi:NTE family protein